MDPVVPKMREIDALDRSLLTALSRDARASGAALATSLGVAESTVSLRLRALRQRQVIRGYRPDLDLLALGASIQALIAIRLASHRRAHVDAFRSKAPDLPGVLSVFHVGGGDDYLLHVAAPDAAALRDFVLNHLTTHPAVGHTETTLVFEHVQGNGWQTLLSHP